MPSSGLYRWDDPAGARLLRREARPVRTYDARFRRRALRLLELCAETPNAAGIAAPQVGWNARVFVAAFSGREGPLTLCADPSIERVSRQALVAPEACLSLPGWSAEVARPVEVVLRYLDERGIPHRAAFDGFAARIALHELDHCSGICYADRAEGARLVREDGGTELAARVLALPPAPHLWRGGA